ncbi:MAG: 2-oxoacid:acceptor oxidoreductase family protein [Candidatus Sumerlaeia bacterium]|nr:2-oxoacid:acceptor oxidoreductase family protein [Candidatus Sumerlaeia bacterium]
MAQAEIRIAGFGGQGVILAGMILGRAAAIHDGKHATMIQAFGPEARGSACSAQLIISDEPVRYPYVQRARYLAALNQDAYHRFEPQLAGDGVLIYEEDLVALRPDQRPGIQAHGIPATRIAEEIGRKIVLNIVFVGFFAAVTGLVSLDAVRRAVAESVPPGTEQLNLAALERGIEHGMRLTAGAA